MINHYTANKKVRNDDAYSPGGRIGLRPDRATMPYCQRAREAFPGVPVIAGGVEASLRRLAHYDYWSDTVKRSILLDSKADLVVFGMGEQPIVEIARRLAGRRDRPRPPRHAGRRLRPRAPGSSPRPTRSSSPRSRRSRPTSTQFAQATRIIHQETNPLNAKTARPVPRPPGRRRATRRACRSARRTWTGSTASPTPAGRTRCTGARRSRRSRPSRTRSRSCAAASAAAPSARSRRTRGGSSSRGRRSRSSTELTPDGPGPELLGRGLRHRRADGQHVPDALHAARGRGEVQAALVRPSQGLQAPGDRPRPARRADAARAARSPGVRKVFVASGIRMDLAQRSPEYMEELAAHHVGGHLKVAPEHTDPDVLKRMKKPEIRRLRRASPTPSSEASDRGGQAKQYLVPYFIASHPGSDLDAMIDLALFLKRNGYRPDQVQDFIPAPFDIATCMYYTGLDPFTGEEVYTAKAPARPQAPAGPAPVLQARELLRGPRGPAQGGPAGPDRLGLRRPDPRQPAQGRPPGPDGEGQPVAGRGAVRPHDPGPAPQKAGYRPDRKTAKRRPR